MIFDLLNIFVRAILVGLAASITVGPVAILCIQRTLSKSRRSGIISGLGVASADTMMAAFAYVFYSIVQAQIVQYDLVLRVVGGSLVIAIGCFLFLQKPQPQLRKNKSGKGSGWQDYISIFGITTANFMMIIPYILAFYAIFNISPIAHFTADELVNMVVVIVGFFLGAAGWWSNFAFVISLLRRRFKPHHLVMINRVAGCLIALLGLGTLLSAVITFVGSHFNI